MTKVTVELEYEQIDAIIVNELKGQIEMVYRQIKANDFVHPDDMEDNKRIGPSLMAVYEYYAGQDELRKLIHELGLEDWPV